MPDQILPDFGQLRDRSILQTLMASAGLQITIVVVTIVSLPFVTRSLNPVEFGVLATLSGFFALLAFADLGVGSALTTQLAQADGRDDVAERSAVVSTAVVAAIVASLMALGLGVLAAIMLPWRQILGAESLPGRQVTLAVLVAVLGTSLTILGSMGQRILYGMRRGRAANNWLSSSAILSAGLSITASVVDAPLYVFVAATLVIPSIMGVVCTWWVLCADKCTPRFSFEAVHFQGMRTLMASSSWFFVIAVSAAFGFQTDILLVTSILGASQAGVFSVAVRVFGLILACLYPALLQLWPAMGEAFVRGDLKWIRSRLRISVLLGGGLALAAGLVIVLFGQPVVSLWLTPDLAPPRGLLISLACWTAYSLAMAPFFLFLNAVGRVRIHALFAVAVAVVNLPLSFALTHQLGMAGPIWGSLLANAAVAGIPGVVIVRRIMIDATATDALSVVDIASDQ